ncbi:hypothetical protein GF407_17105 [candidate division KSB1 bacterium]|nr:hypothetical protein [candidate division KSB1 bacterium]
MFATVLHHLKSPENTGMIVRMHVAFNGNELIIVGPEPWRFKKRTQAFSRRLEKICNLIYLKDDEALFEWFDVNEYTPVAVEIAENPNFLPDFVFPPRPAIIVGNEGTGLAPDFIDRCGAVVTIPQYGPVACLNVAMSCGVAIYEFMRNKPVKHEISQQKYVIDDVQSLPADQE